jgi:SAM-dependent methyltransferase
MRIGRRISWDDNTFGNTYTERTKAFRRFYTSWYNQARFEDGTTFYYRKVLLLNYLFKGPVLEWYVRVKMKLERNFEICTGLMPRKGKILDIGCGYGYVSYLLSMTSPERKITAVDYDPEKIRVASQCFSKNENLNFICGDINRMDFETMDGFLLLDVLHYFPVEDQVSLLNSCIARLDDQGVIVIRDADAGLGKRHKGSRLTEFFSTGIGFNKTREGGGLFFSSSETIRRVAEENGLTLEIIDNKKITSNLIYIISGKPKKKESSGERNDQEDPDGKM